MTQNQIRYWELQETKRANRTKEAETERSNRESESIGRSNVSIGWANSEINRWNVLELQRSNKASEAIASKNAQTNRLNAYSNASRAASAANQASAATRQARAAEMQAYASNLNAEANYQKTQLEKDFQPYRKVESFARSAQSIVQAGSTIGGWVATLFA